MIIKTPKEIKIMRKSGRIVALILRELAKACQVGVYTNYLETLAEKIILGHGAVPSFKGFQGYEYATCISVNDEVVHGLPSKRVIKEGDLVSIDVGANIEGFHGDAAITVGVGKISTLSERLLKTTKSTLDLAILMSAPGVKLAKIQKKMQEHVEKAGFGVVRDLSGHGIGRSLQERPIVANYERGDHNIVLVPGMTFTYEPMVTAGSWRVKTKDDGWTVVTSDHSLACHFEHTIVITKNGCEILTKIN